MEIKLKHYFDLGFASLGFMLVIAILLAFFITACNGPRSATMCINNKTGTWIKCPKGIEVDSIVE